MMLLGKDVSSAFVNVYKHSLAAKNLQATLRCGKLSVQEIEEETQDHQSD